ncbi:MAG: hypothetical protein ACOVQX_01755 [Legionella sp.]
MLFFKDYKIKCLIKKIKAFQQARQLNLVNDDAIKKEIAAYYTLADIYISLQGRKKYPFAHEMSLECYRAAAILDDANAHFLLGNSLLEKAKFRDDLQNKSIFASHSNAKQVKQLYEEALAYLQGGEQLKHIQAKRMLGLCYINGWGLASDKKRGFDLIVASIDDENSWEQVPQIFASLGLNKPEFYNALTQHKNKSST